MFYGCDCRTCGILLTARPEILLDLAEILNRGSLPIRPTLFKKSFQILNFGSNGMHPKFTVLVHFGTQFIAGKPKILLKTKVSGKTTSLGVSNKSQVPEKSHNSCKIKFLGPNL